MKKPNFQPKAAPTPIVQGGRYFIQEWDGTTCVVTVHSNGVVVRYGQDGNPSHRIGGQVLMQYGDTVQHLVPATHFASLNPVLASSLPN